MKMDRGRGRGRGGRGGQTARGGHVPQHVEANQPPPLIASSSDVWAKLGALQQLHDEDEQYWGAGDGYVESALNVETPAYVPGGGLSHPGFAAPTFGLNAASYGGYDDVSSSRSNAAPNSGYGASQAYNVPQGSAGGFGGYVASGVHAGVSNVAASYGGYDQFTAPSAAGYSAPMYQQTVSAGQSAPVPQMYSNDAPTHSGFDANRGGRGGGRAGARGGRGGAAAAAAGHGHGGPRGGAMHDDAEADHAGADAKAHASRRKDDGGAPRGHGQPAAAPAAPSATKPRTAQEAAAALLAAKAAAAASTTAAAAPQESKPPAAGGKFSTKASKTAAEAAAELLASKAAAAAAASNAAAPVAAQAPPPAVAASKKVPASPANPFTGGKPGGKAAKAPAPSAEDADAAGGAFSAGAVPVQSQPAAGRSKASNAGKVHAPTDASPPPSSIPPPSEFEPVDAFVASSAAPAATRASRPSAAGAGRPARAPAKTSVSNPFAKTFSTAKPATAAAGAPAAAPADDAGAAAGAAAVAAAAEEAAARARRDEILAEYKARRDREESERRARQEADRRRRDEERRAREAAEAQRIAEENAEKQRVEDAARAKEMEMRMKEEQAKRQAEVDLKKGLPMPGQDFKKGTVSGASKAPAPAAAPAGLPAQPAPVSTSPSFDPKVAEEQKRRLLAQQQPAQLHQAVAASVAATAAPASSGAAHVESVEADGDHDDDHNIDSSYAAAQADAASRRAAAASATRTAAPAAAASAASSSSTGVAGSDFTTWSCSACTYENYPDLLACEMCGKSKPSQKVSAAERERIAAAAAHEAAMEQQRIAREQEKISAERRKKAMEEAERLEKERKVAEIAEAKRKQEEKEKKDAEIAEARRKKADEKEKKRREKEAQDATEATFKLWQCLGCGSIHKTDDTVQSCDKCSCKRGQKPEPKPETPVKPPAPVAAAAAATPAAQASAAPASKPSATKSSPPKPSAATAASPAPSPAKPAPAASAAAASASAPASASKASASKPSPPPSAQQQQPEHEPIEHRTKPKLKALGPKVGPKTAAVKKGGGISKGAWCECTFENGCTFVGRCLMWDADKERYQMCTCEDADDHSAGDCDTWYHEAGIGADDKVSVKEIIPTQPAGQDDIDRPRIMRAWLVNQASRTSRGTRYFPAPKHLEALDARSVLLDCSDGVLRTAMVQGIDDGSCSGHIHAACLAVNDGGRVPFSGGEGGVGGMSIQDGAEVVAPWIELDIFGSPWFIGGEGDGMPHVGGGVDTENLNVECMGMPAAALILGSGSRVVCPAPPKPINIKQSFTAAKSNIANEVLVPNGQYVAVPVFDRTTGKEDLFVGRVECYDTDSGNYYISSGTNGLYHSLRGCVWLKANRQIKKDYDDEDFVEACLYLGHLPSTIPLPKGSPVVIDMRDGVLTSGEIAEYDPITQEYGVHITDPSAPASRRGTNELVERRTCGFTAAGVLRYSTNGNCEPSNDLSAPKVALKSRPKQRASCPAGAYPIGSWVRAATGDDESPFFIGRIDGRSAVDSSSGFMYTVANKDDIVEFPHKRLTLLAAEVPAVMVALDASAAPAAANVGQLRAWPLGNVPAGVTASSLQSCDGGEVLVYEPRKQDFTIGTVVPASAGFVAGAFIAVEPNAPSTAAASASAPALLVPLGNVWTPSSR